MARWRYWLVEVPALITEWWEWLYKGLLLLMIVVLYSVIALTLLVLVLGY